VAKMLDQLTLFAGDTPASHSVQPGSVEARKMTVTSGLKCAVLSKNSGPLGCLEKMLLGTSVWASTKCFLTWRHSATPRGRLLFQLVPSMPGTDETEFGLWPTPTAQNAKHAGLSPAEMDRVLTGKGGLHAVVHFYPTPQASDWKNRGGWGSASVQRRKEIGKQIMLSMVAGGPLNPVWVEWLQGFPSGWTDLRRSETA
jgi:hypothetical protein